MFSVLFLKSWPTPTLNAAPTPWRCRRPSSRDSASASVDRRDARELRLERLHPVLLDPGLVHPDAVQLPDLRLHRPGRRAPVRRCVIEDLVEDLEVLLLQLAPGTPARAVRGNRVVREPRAAGVLVEVLARVDFWIHLGRIDPVRTVRGGEARGQEKKSGDGERPESAARVEFPGHGGTILPSKAPWYLRKDPCRVSPAARSRAKR